MAGPLADSPAVPRARRIKSRWLGRTSCFCLLVGYLVGLALAIYAFGMAEPGSTGDLVVSSWLGVFMAYGILPLFWGSLLWAVLLVILVPLELVFRTLAPYLHPKTRALARSLRHSPPDTGAPSAARQNEEALQKHSGSPPAARRTASGPVAEVDDIEPGATRKAPPGMPELGP
jgi:hypothetical protein